MNVGVCVIAYNRPHYFQDVARSLAANPESRDLPLHFFLDGGPGATQPENEAIISACGFPRRRVVRRTRNLGCEANIVQAHRFMFDEAGCDAIIHLEDDLVLSPHYLRLTRRLLEWATAHYDNVGAVQAWDRCLLSRAEKRERLRHVRPRCQSAHWWGYALARRAWDRMRHVVDAYEERFLCRETGDRLDDGAVRAFIRQTVDGGPRAPGGRLAPAEPNAEPGFLHPHVATGNDSIHALALWQAGLVRLCTVVNRARNVGRVGLHATEEFFEATRLDEVALDVFDEDRDLSSFEIAG